MLHRPDRIALKRLDPETGDFHALLDESRQQGFWMLVRLLDDWESGANRFARRDETLLAAWRHGELAGVCGLNLDPYVATRNEGRVRHLYVASAHRRAGIGRLLLYAVIDKARRHFPALNLRAPREAFAFYQALGFARVEQEYATHRMTFLRPAMPRRKVRKP